MVVWSANFTKLHWNKQKTKFIVRFVFHPNFVERASKLGKSLYFFSNKEESFFLSLIWSIISISRLLSIEWGISFDFAVKISLRNWPWKFRNTFFWQKCSFLHIKHGTTHFFHNESYFFLILALTYMSWATKNTFPKKIDIKFHSVGIFSIFGRQETAVR